MVTQRKNTQVRQKQIVSAARKLIVRYGSEHVTVRRMAKEIGVSEGAIYRHFKSKRDIIHFLIGDIENTLIGDIEKNYTGKLNPLETLENIIAGHISSMEQRKGVVFLVIAEIVSLGDKKLNKEVYDVIEKYLERIKLILADGINEGLLRPDLDLDAAAILFFSMSQGMVDIWALSQYNFDLNNQYKSIWNVYSESIIKR